MAKCPRLDFEWSKDYICKVTGQTMKLDDPKVKFTCNAEYGCNYEKCEAYQKSK